MSATERLKLIIAYDGRHFRGWQSQAAGGSVQDHLQSAFAKLTASPACVQASGRTDSGVHALGQVAHVDVPRGTRAPAAWLTAINANLPASVRVLRVTRAAPGFHSRRDALGKRYVYRIWNGPCHHPLEIGRVWYVARPLDLPAMRAAAALLVGRHDFAAFAANRGKIEHNTVRTITRIAITRRGPLITLRFEGEGFLYKMVRLLTGTIARVGEGKADAGFVRVLLASGGRKKSQFTAPPEGLYLDRVFYPRKKSTAASA